MLAKASAGQFVSSAECLDSEPGRAKVRSAKVVC